MRQGLTRRRPPAGRGRGLSKRFALAASLAAVSLAASAAPAAASVTLGQLAPSTSGGPTGIDLIQLAVASGNSYRVPGNGTITSWSHNAGSGASQMLTMKVFRKVADPNFYKVIGLDSEGPLDAGLLNTFPVSIPVQPGDLIGLDALSGPVSPLFPGVPADMYLNRAGDLHLADAAGFSGPASGSKLNLTALFVPSNTVTAGATTLNKRKGTATVNLTLPNAGQLTASGTGLTATSGGHPVNSISVGAGPAQLLIKAKGRKRRTLNRAGSVKLNLSIAYTPANGDPATQVKNLKLKKNR